MAIIFKGIYRPKVVTGLRGSGKKPENFTYLMYSLSRALKSKGGHYHSRGNSAINRQQRCIIKARVSYGKKKLVAHLAYISRQGAGREGAEPSTYGSVGFDSLASGPYASESRHFRFIISPESPDANLKVLCKELICSMERACGEKLVWKASEHYNTNHPHVHLVVLGNENVVFSRKFIRETLRNNASAILTKMLGPRTLIRSGEIDVVNKNVRTRIDSTINSLIADNGYLKVATINRLPIKDARLLNNRIEHLINLNLCHTDKSNIYFNKDWLEQLDNMRRYDLYLRLRNKANGNLAIYKPSAGLTQSGRVVYVGKLSEIDDHGSLLVVKSSEEYLFISRPVRVGNYRPRAGDSVIISSMAVEYEDKSVLRPAISISSH